MAVKTYLQAISDGLRSEMQRDKRVFIIGEDVGVYGGAFKVTQGFQEEFGPWRVIDAPLSETAIVGGCTGAADDRRLGKRRVDVAPGAELLLEALCHLEGPAADADVLTDDEDALVALHLGAEPVGDRLKVGLYRHQWFLR